jgi:hypothetical protein
MPPKIRRFVRKVQIGNLGHKLLPIARYKYVGQLSKPTRVTKVNQVFIRPAKSPGTWFSGDHTYENYVCISQKQVEENVFESGQTSATDCGVGGKFQVN